MKFRNRRTDGQPDVVVLGLARCGLPIESEVAKKQLPQKTVVAIPDNCSDFEGRTTEVICPATSVPFGGVGAGYRDFHQVSDDQVHQILKSAKQARFQEPA